MKNRLDYLRFLFGIWHAGGVVVPVNAKLHSKEATWIFKDAEVCLAFVESTLKSALGADSSKSASLRLILVSDGLF